MRFLVAVHVDIAYRKLTAIIKKVEIMTRYSSEQLLGHITALGLASNDDKGVPISKLMIFNFLP